MARKSERTTYWVSPTGDSQWKVKREGAERAAAVYDDKADAVARAKELAKGEALGQVVIQRGDGQIQTEYTYGKDPERSPG